MILFVFLAAFGAWNQPYTKPTKQMENTSDDKVSRHMNMKLYTVVFLETINTKPKAQGGSMSDQFSTVIYSTVTEIDDN